ncbi:MAG TPA: hypothetical protein PLV25_05790, partial [Opitutales bacterium]|nr:hypothetical protein [Opitutales bacterium]
AIFEYAHDKAQGHPFFSVYGVTDMTAKAIVDTAIEINAKQLILGSSTRHRLVVFLSGNIIQDVAKLLPEKIHLSIYV